MSNQYLKRLESKGQTPLMQVSLCTVPAEILSAIFEAGKDMVDEEFLDIDTTLEERRGMTPFEVVVSQVCLHFRTVAFGTATLWTSIEIHFKSALEPITRRVARSSSCPLDIYVNLESHLPLTLEMDGILNLIISNSTRWRSLTIVCEYERINIPIARRLCSVSAPKLRLLSVTVDNVDQADAQAINMTTPQIFQHEPTKLEFVRLRGMAMYLLRPNLNAVTILHLDQTRTIPLLYSTFRFIVTCSKALAHLSIHGDMIEPSLWPRRTHDIHLPSLRSLRLRGVAGDVYSGVLLAIHAPELESLTLKDMQEHDLQLLWERPDAPKYPNLKSMTFCGFDLCLTTIEYLAKIFKNVANFHSFHSSIHESTVVDLLLEGVIENQLTHDPPQVLWPKLHVLSFPLDDFEMDKKVIQDIVQVRKDCGHPISQVSLRIGVDDAPETRSSIRVEDSTIKIQILQGIEVWPEGRTLIDHDDNLFP